MAREEFLSECLPREVLTGTFRRGSGDVLMAGDALEGYAELSLELSDKAGRLLDLSIRGHAL